MAFTTRSSSRQGTLRAGALGVPQKQVPSRVKVQGGKGYAKVPDAIVALIKRDGAVFPYKEIAAHYGVSVTYVGQIMQGLLRTKVEPAPWPDGMLAPHLKGKR